MWAFAQKPVHAFEQIRVPVAPDLLHGQSTDIKSVKCNHMPRPAFPDQGHIRPALTTEMGMHNIRPDLPGLARHVRQIGPAAHFGPDLSPCLLNKLHPGGDILLKAMNVRHGKLIQILGSGAKDMLLKRSRKIFALSEHPGLGLGEPDGGGMEYFHYIILQTLKWI
jgi:hypothetical protein